jgi:hypothetical protein
VEQRTKENKTTLQKLHQKPREMQGIKSKGYNATETGAGLFIGQTSTAYTLSGGAANVGVEETRKTDNEQVQVIHTVPVMTDDERNAATKRIGSDLYEIFMRIQEELGLDNEIAHK